MSFLDNLDTSVLEGILNSTAAKGTSLVTCTIEELVTDADLAEYCERVAAGDLPGPKSIDTDLQKIRARHHSVARLLASGVPEGVVATITRFSPSRISQLKNSPAMQELISHYRGPGAEASQVLAEKLRVLGDSAAEELAERITERPDELSTQDLVAISKLGLDRSGHGPSSKLEVDQTTHLVDHAELLKLRQGVRASEASRITRLQPKALPPPSEDERDVDAA